MSGADVAATDVVTVVLRRFPLRVWARAQDYYDELMREFRLLELEGGGGVPQRLLSLIAELTANYSDIGAEAVAARERALKAGERTVDLYYPTPVTARASILEFSEVLEEVDVYCRAGQHLLTLAPTEETVAFRRWYVAQFIRQLDGEPPTPWPGTVD